MAIRGTALLLIGLMLGGCMQATIDPASDANLTARDRKLLANAPYARVQPPPQYQRSIVEYHRKEAPGSIVIDTDARYLYYVLADNKAIRYGVTVGEEALSWYGIAKVGRKEEWPTWTPTADIKRRLGNIPDHMPGAVCRGRHLELDLPTDRASVDPTAMRVRPVDEWHGDTPPVRSSGGR